MGQAKTYGLLGNPIKHSFSPAMHNAALRALKINAKYKLFEKDLKQLPVFFASLKKNNICGFNVTIPYKERALEYLNSKSSGVREIGAANTVVVSKEGKLTGFNTDYLGFAKHLLELKVKPKNVALIGAGGAAKAVCFALGKKSSVGQIAIFDLDKFKSVALVKRFKDVFPQVSFSAVARVEDLKIQDKDLLINASPVGMKQDDHCLIDAAMLHKDLFVYDLIYNPAETKLLKLAKDRGLRFSNGLGMLLYQGVESLAHWIKPKKPPVEIMRQALSKELKKC